MQSTSPQTRARPMSRTHNPYAFPATPTGERGSAAATPVDMRMANWSQTEHPGARRMRMGSFGTPPTGMTGPFQEYRPSSAMSPGGDRPAPYPADGRSPSSQQCRPYQPSPLLEQSARGYVPQREVDIKVGGETVSRVMVTTPQPMGPPAAAGSRRDVAPIRLGSSSRRAPGTVAAKRAPPNTADRAGNAVGYRPHTATAHHFGRGTPSRRLDMGGVLSPISGSYRTPAAERVPSPPAFDSHGSSPTGDCVPSMPPPQLPDTMTPPPPVDPPFAEHVVKALGARPLAPPESPRKTEEGLATIQKLYDQSPSMFAIPAAVPPGEKCERDAKTVEGRRRQVALGQLQPEYKRYVQLVPKERREAGNPKHPVSPRPEYNFSCREFKKIIHAWRCVLHLYGDEDTGSNFLGTGRSVYDASLYNTGAAAAADRATPAVDGSDAATPEVPGTPERTSSETGILVQDVEDDARGQSPRRTPPTTPRHQLAPSTPSTRKGATPLHTTALRPTPLKHASAGGTGGAHAQLSVAPASAGRQLFSS